MRKFGLLSVAAGLALTGSVARADYTITSARVNNGATDTVTFSVQDNGSGGTSGFPLLNAVSVALYDPNTSGGLFVTTSAAGKVNAYSGTQSHIVQMTDGSSTLGVVQAGPHVLNLNGTLNVGGTGYTASSTIQVSGIGGAIGEVGNGIDDVTT